VCVVALRGHTLELAMLAVDPNSLDIERPLANFAKHGYARLGVVLSPEGVQRLRRRCEELMLGIVRYPNMFFQHDSPNGRYADLRYGKGWTGPSLHYRKLEGLEFDASVRCWIENALFARIAHSAIGDAVSLYRAVLWNKAANAGTELPWHQDDGVFWGIDRPPCLQIWTALDDASEDSGCLEFVPTSHLAGLASPQGGTVQAAQLTESNALQRSLKLAVQAGEAVLIHNHVWHRSGRNKTPLPRRAIGVSYLDATTRCLRRRRAPREFQRVFASA
jgi:phytanoyl-CoA hydroxylase